MVKRFDEQEMSVRIRVSKTEHTLLHKQAKSCSKSLSQYLRNVGLNYPIESKVDQIALSELLKVKGDLGRLGGLFKLWLSNTKEELNPRLGNKASFQVEQLVKDIEQNKQELLEIARRLL